MSDTEFLDNPAAVLKSVKALLAEPAEVDDHPQDSDMGNVLTPLPNVKSPPTKGKGKGKFIPKGEGSSGLSRVPPVPAPPRSPAGPPTGNPSSEQKVLEMLSTPPGEEVEASYIDIPPFPELPPIGETSTPVRYEEEDEVWATKREVHDIVETLDEFIKLEIKEALGPILRDLKVISSDVKALSGASSALIQKMSSLQVKILNLERARPATITSSSHIAVAPTSKLPAVEGTSSASGGGVMGSPVPLSPVAKFLRSYPTYIDTVILRKVRLTELARDMGHKGPLPAIGKTDWTESKLTQKFSSGK
jgi:hypothetical protein